MVANIRLTLLKIGAVVIRNTRRVSLYLSTSCPQKARFHLAAARLKPGYPIAAAMARPIDLPTAPG